MPRPATADGPLKRSAPWEQSTDLQTLADIFGCGVWSSRKMARTGEWERQGIKIFRIGAHYRVGVESILDVLGFTSGDFTTPGTAQAGELDQAGENAADSAVIQAPGISCRRGRAMNRSAGTGT